LDVWRGNSICRFSYLPEVNNIGRAYNACLQILQVRFQSGSISFFSVFSCICTAGTRKNGLSAGRRKVDFLQTKRDANSKYKNWTMLKPYKIIGSF